MLNCAKVLAVGCAAVVAVALVALMVLSYVRPSVHCRIGPPHVVHEYVCSRGWLHISIYEFPQTLTGKYAARAMKMGIEMSMPGWLGEDIALVPTEVKQAYLERMWGEDIQYRSNRYPLHLLAIFLALPTLPALVIVMRPALRRLRAVAMSCRECGYNLTGNVSGQCPECGAALPGEFVRRDGVEGRSGCP